MYEAHALTESFVKNVLSKDKIFLQLTSKFQDLPYKKYRFKNVAQMQRWQSMDLLIDEEKQYLDLVAAWHIRFNFLRISHFDACFNLTPFFKS
tara:strand:+ start:181 stop:459 length:279 start_codon:yes stop_codon:yes gene_type:complete